MISSDWGMKQKIAEGGPFYQYKFVLLFETKFIENKSIALELELKTLVNSSAWLSIFAVLLIKNTHLFPCLTSSLLDHNLIKV